MLRRLRFLHLASPTIVRLGFACACLAWVGAAWAGQAEVRVGMGLAKPPYIMESGKEGLEYEIAEQVLAAIGYKMVALQFPPVRGLAMQRAGKLDVLLTVDEGIGGKDHFSAPYLNYQNVAITLASRNIRLRGVEDLSAYSIAGFQNASLILGERFRAVVARHPNYQEHSQQIAQDRLLFTGRVDVVVGDKLIFRYFTSRLDPQLDTSQPVIFHTIFPLNPRKAVFKDAALRDRFNAGLKIIQTNGVYDAILRKYQPYMN